MEHDRAIAAESGRETLAAITARITNLEERKQQLTDAATAEREKLQQELAEIPDGTEAQITAAREKVDELTAQRESFEQALDDARSALTALQGQLGSIQSQIQRMDAARQQAEYIEAEIAQWTLLATALGNDGIIALSIDDAGPTISNIANELMKECYGPRFTLSIKTQRPTAAGDLRETFDIIVWDAESGESKSIRDMSGGQRVYLNEVLTRAIALFQAQTSGQHYETLFADESDGALDAEKKVEFTQMKQRVLEIGGYEREFFITHVPEIWDMADRHIDIGSLVS